MHNQWPKNRLSQVLLTAEACRASTTWPWNRRTNASVSILHGCESRLFDAGNVTVTSSATRARRQTMAYCW